MLGPIALATFRTSAVLGVRLLVQAGTLLLVARLLGPEQFGVFTGVAALAVMLGCMSTFGTHLVLLGQVSREPKRGRQVLSYAIPITLLFGLMLLAIFALACILVLDDRKVTYGIWLSIGVAELLLSPLSTLIVSELLAKEQTARSQLLQTFPLILRLAVAAVVLTLQFSEPLSVYAYGYGLSMIVALMVAFWWLHESWPHPRLWRWPTWKELREAFSYAVLNMTAMGPAELDKALALKLLPLSVVGLYAAAARMVGAITLPVVALMLSALPRLFREGRDQPRQIIRLLRWIFGAASLYGIGFSVVLWLCAPLFVQLLGPDYVGVDDTIRWLCLAIPGMVVRVAAGSALMALGKAWVRAAFEVVGLIVLAGTAILLTVRWGVHGMASALVCAEWTMAILGCCLIVRSLPKP